MLLNTSAAGAALDPPQPAALVPHHPRHRHRRQRGDHDGHAGQRRDAGDQDADLRPGHQPADGAARPALGPGRRRRRGVPQFKEADAEAIAAQIGGVAAVAPEGRASVTVVANGRNWSTSVIGSTNAWFDTGNWKLASGRIFEPTSSAPAPPCASSARRCGARSSAAPRPDRPRRAAARASSSRARSSASSPPRARAAWDDQDDTVLVPLRTLQRRVTGNQQGGHAAGVDARRQRQRRALKASLTPAAARAAQARRRRRRQLQHLRHPATGRDAVEHDPGDDHAARRGGGGEPAGRRHRHHEHHAGQRDRAHPRDRPAPRRSARWSARCCCSS